VIDPRDARLTPRSELDWGSERGLFRVVDDAAHPDGGTWSGAWRKNTDELRMKDFAIHAAGVGRGTRVLDLGCADGAQMTYCGLLGAECYGQDLSEASVAVANEKLARLGLTGEAKVGDATSLQFDDNSFDVVLSSDFHEHLTDDQQRETLREVWRVLRPGGRFALKTPNLTYLRASLTVKRLAALAKGRSPLGLTIPHTPGTDDPQHVGLVGRGVLERQLVGAGFEAVEILHAPMRKLGVRPWMTVLSTEIPVLRDVLNEALYSRAYKPIAASYFPT
jgi:SAM-dependent methyltransferase